jgi:nitroreductase
MNKEGIIETNNLFETIFSRRSVRKYSPIPLDSNELAKIERFVQDTAQLSGQSARFQILPQALVERSTAPHSILAYCEESNSQFANVGYLLENIDLYLQSIGLGSCWLGGGRPKQKQSDFCILLTFGRTDEADRKGSKDFHRLPLSEISNVDNVIAQAARLAPSAMNSQPWKLHFIENTVTIEYKGRGLAKPLLGKKLNKIDVGIITRHVQVALEHEGNIVTAITPNTKGKDFTVTVTYNKL